MLTWVGAQWAHMAEWLNSVLGTSFDTDPETFRIANDRFSIINTSLSGQFNLHMKISLLTGLAMAMPYTLWEFWRFVRPALTPKEIQGTHLFVFWVSLCFFGGLLFGYFVMALASLPGKVVLGWIVLMGAAFSIIGTAIASLARQ